MPESRRPEDLTRHELETSGMTALLRTMRTAVAAAALVALAGCATTAADPGASSGAPSAAGSPGPGVTADTVKVGLIVLAGANSAGSGGFVVSPQGDTKKQAQVVVDAINAAGGIGGRKVDLVIREFTSSTGSPTTETAMCTSFTQDDEVFAVLMLGQRTSAARSCYKKASTVMVDISQAAQPVSTYTSLAPYYWTPNSRDLDSATSAMIDDLSANGFLAATAKVGVLVEKEATFEGVYSSVVTPALQELGITPVEQVIDQSTSENAFATAGSAAAAFQGEGVDRILFLGRPDNVGYFTTFTTQQAYYPKLAIGSFETPTFVAQNPSVYAPESLAGSQGIGFMPDVDGTKAFAFPQPGAEQTCIDTLSKAGVTFGNRFEAKTALRFCDGFGFLKAAGDKVGTAPLNAESLAAAAATLGTTWQAATTLSTSIAPSGTQLYAPAASYKSLSYDGSWFEYGASSTDFS
jgi:ABC-type branched-subunit amino acid transport system substrate-binding protein